MTILSDVFYTARQKHRCVQCGWPIYPSEKYRRQTYVVSGDFCTYKAHIDCDKAGEVYNNLFIDAYEDEMYNLIDCMSDKDDRNWLKENYPTVAKRMGIK